MMILINVFILIKEDASKIDATIASHLSLDPTLPRVNNLQCPNANCATNTEMYLMTLFI